MIATREVWLRRPTYADGSLVREGDRIRYHQALGGLMSPGSGPNGDIWNYGVAVLAYAHDDAQRASALASGIDVDEIVISVEAGPYKGRTCHLFSHVIERQP